MLPRVSVVIPVYNTKDYLIECLNSVCEQTLKDIEIICIDDASTDGSYEILKKRSTLDSRIRLIRKDSNSGQAEARNIGFQMARGEYVYFFDSDDLIEHEALEKLYYLAYEHYLDGIIFNEERIYENEYLERTVRLGQFKIDEEIESRGVINGEEIFILTDGDRAVNPGRSFWRREYLKENAIYHLKEASPHEDNLFFMMATLNAKRMMGCSETLHRHRARPNSAMTGQTVDFQIKHAKAYFVVWIEGWQFLKSHTFKNDGCRKKAYECVSRCLPRVRNRSKVIPFDILKSIGFENDIYNVMFNSVIIKHQGEFINNPNNVNKLLLTFPESEVMHFREKQKIYIYGAGICGKKVLQMLLMLGIERENIAFIVSRMSDNQAEVDGVSVILAENVIRCFDTGKDAMIVAMTGKYRREVNSYLDSRGVQYISVVPSYILMEEDKG